MGALLHKTTQALIHILDVIGNNRQGYKKPLKIGFFMSKSLLPITSIDVERRAMKPNKSLSLFLFPILFVSACNGIQQANPTIRELPTDSQWSKNGIIFEKPIWKIIKDDNDSLSSIHVEVSVKNNNNEPIDVSFDFELWSSGGNVLATCSTSSDIGVSSIGANNIVSSNGTAIMQCTHTIYMSINEADLSSYSLRYGVITNPLDEVKPSDVEVLETGFEKTSEGVNSVRYTVYARIKSKSIQDVTTRFYVLDNQGVQFMGCETDIKLKSESVVRVECEVAYSTNMINQSPASVIVDILESEQ